jgi:hypothetical protein
MEEEMRKEIQGMLARIKPSLGGASKQSKVIYTERRYQKCV